MRKHRRALHEVGPGADRQKRFRQPSLRSSSGGNCEISFGLATTKTRRRFLLKPRSEKRFKKKTREVVPPSEATICEPAKRLSIRHPQNGGRTRFATAMARARFLSDETTEAAEHAPHASATGQLPLIRDGFRAQETLAETLDARIRTAWAPAGQRARASMVKATAPRLSAIFEHRQTATCGKAFHWSVIFHKPLLRDDLLFFARTS